MQVKSIGSLAVVALVVLAGCSGVVSQGDRASATAAPGTDVDATASQGYSVTVVSQTSGSSDDGVDFYVSDEENAIGDFAHLNVTITRVGFQRAGGEDAENEGGWVQRDVDNRSVDLTRLRGANATRLTTVDAPNGSYDTVFAHVDEVTATLDSGERVSVKLPSEKLQIRKSFTVGANDSVDFVFDIAVHKAGNSGKYILRPVVGQSGTDVPMESIDTEREDEDDEEGDEGALDVAFVDNVTRGANATIEVTRNGTAVENATVAVGDEQVGTTDADGQATFAVPDDDEPSIEVRSGAAETELELSFENDSADATETEDETGTEDVEGEGGAETAETIEPTETVEPAETSERTDATGDADS